jgi:hypothetical protein
VLYSRYPHIIEYGQAAACPRAAQKTRTYRSPRFQTAAALVPSAGTIAFKIDANTAVVAVLAAIRVDTLQCQEAKKMRPRKLVELKKDHFVEPGLLRRSPRLGNDVGGRRT